jgi:ABC-type Fe3+ transport system permease subunit
MSGKRAFVYFLPGLSVAGAIFALFVLGFTDAGLACGNTYGRTLWLGCPTVVVLLCGTMIRNLPAVVRDIRMGVPNTPQDAEEPRHDSARP